MKIVVIGGTGLIGSKLVAKLAAHGRDAVPASPGTGVNTLTGEGLTEPSPARTLSSSVELAVVRGRRGTRVLRDINPQHPRRGGGRRVGHHVALSVVGTERMAESGYMRAKIAQEKLIKNSSIPYTIVHATQFFEFAVRTADEASDGDTVRVPPVLIQPMAADDVAAAVCNVSPLLRWTARSRSPGREPLRFEDFVRRGLRLRGISASWSPILKPGTSGHG